ncbi:MAG: NUDIX hydrolase [Magnetococcales bacterium]|nr:NUDIX hydrolase [Magnetococcales bacterium]
MQRIASVSAHVLIIDRPVGSPDLKLLMARLAYRDHRNRTWSFPGGFVDENESVEKALTREVCEEIGVELKRWKQVDIIPAHEKQRLHIGFLYVSEEWKGEPEVLSHELLEIGWFDQHAFFEAADHNQLAYPFMKDQVRHIGWDLPEQQGEVVPKHRAGR